MGRKNVTGQVRIMANLEYKSKMSAIQLAIMIIAVQLDILPIGFSDLLREGGQSAWLCVLAGGIVFYSSAYVSIRLAQQFPGETFVEYVPRVWGRRLGFMVLLLYLSVFVFETWIGLQAAAREISFYMFDRTPYEIILGTYLAASAYCALQDLGTILRVVQMMALVGTVILFFLLLLSGVAFQTINLFPLISGSFPQFASGVWETWPVFSGYMLLLMLLPYVGRNEQNIAKVVGYGFIFFTAIAAWIVMLTIGGLGIATAQNVSFPMVTLIRTIEIPGTFLERLDTYMVTIKVMIFFNSCSVVQYVKAVALAKFFGHADHRPWVLATVPLLFIGSDALHTMRLYETVRTVSIWLGFIFAFAVLPATLYLAKRRQSGSADWKMQNS